MQRRATIPVMSDLSWSANSSSEVLVRVERPEPAIALVTLDDPRRRNAMTTPMTEQWGAAMAALRTDRDLRCVVITGAGPAFCAGGDLGWIGADPQASVVALRERMLPFYRTWLSLRDLEVPTIAAVNGPAVGAGAALVLACDVRYAGPSASFSVPFTRLGMHPGMGITYLLPTAIGVPAARELLFTGRHIDADEMARLGVVTEVVDDVVAHSLEAARAVAACAPLATRLTKAALDAGVPGDLDAALHWEAVAQPATLATHDLQEGLAAARERRDPSFRGA